MGKIEDSNKKINSGRITRADKVYERDCILLSTKTKKMRADILESFKTTTRIADHIVYDREFTPDPGPDFGAIFCKPNTSF